MSTPLLTTRLLVPPVRRDLNFTEAETTDFLRRVMQLDLPAALAARQAAVGLRLPLADALAGAYEADFQLAVGNV